MLLKFSFSRLIENVDEIGSGMRDATIDVDAVCMHIVCNDWSKD